MVSPTAGSVVLVSFPFSDLSATKLRPAIVLASARQEDWILCQVTSNPYSDPNAIEINDSGFLSGSLHHVSFARPSKLFTANISLMKAEVGRLNSVTLQSVLDATIAIIKG